MVAMTLFRRTTNAAARQDAIRAAADEAPSRVAREPGYRCGKCARLRSSRWACTSAALSTRQEIDNQMFRSFERLSQTPLAVCRPWTAVRGRVDGESTHVSQSARMDSLQTATDIERVQRASAYSWEQVVAAIRNYARTQPPLVAADLQEWANLLEGIHQLNEPQRR